MAKYLVNRTSPWGRAGDVVEIEDNESSVVTHHESIGTLSLYDGPVEVQYDPSEHSVDEVSQYLDTLTEEGQQAEFVRVLDAEKAGKGRKGIVENYGQVEAEDAVVDEDAEEPDAE